jgi:hypothetical protein
MHDRTRTLVRAGLGFITFINLFTGLWAVLAPASWFRAYPGLGRDWIAGAGGPYNMHLSVDAGAGFLAVGIVTLLAAVWLDRRVVQVAAIAVLVADGPHFLFHVLHPSGYPVLDEIFGVGGLGALCLIAIGVLLALRAPSREAVAA